MRHRNVTFWGAIAAIAASLAFFSGGAALAETADAASAARPISSTIGIASYYGAEFNGRRTADGEIFDMHGLSAANKTLPIPCYARVTNLGNGRSIVVRVNDRGPFVAGRMLDVSERVARLLSFSGGMARVKLDYLGKAGPGGGDQRALLASLKDPRDPAPAKRGETQLASSRPADAAPLAASAGAALAYSDSVASAPAAAALAAALRPTLGAPPAAAPLTLAARLDTGARKIEAALETAAHATATEASNILSPYGKLVVAPFRPKTDLSN